MYVFSVFEDVKHQNSWTKLQPTKWLDEAQAHINLVF
jgi:hypothetical protein